MASNANDYIIYHIDQDGKLVEKYDHTNGRATCLIDSINIVRAMLKTDNVRPAFVELATKHCQKYSDTTWYLQGEEGTPEKINEIVDRFLKIFLIPVFPNFCISDCMANLRLTGSSYRYSWQYYFPMFAQRMVLNGVWLQKMLDLKMRAKLAGDKEGHILNAYRIIQFHFVVTILHEFSHIFISYLGEGLDQTPPDPDGEKGESGFRLEELVFGGRVEFRRDKRDKDNNYGAGFVFMTKQDEDDVERIEWFSVMKEAIENTLDTKFRLPFKEGGGITKLEPGHLGNLALMGEEGERKAETDDPGLHEEWNKRREEIDPEWSERYDKLYKKIADLAP